VAADFKRTYILDGYKYTIQRIHDEVSMKKRRAKGDGLDFAQASENVQLADLPQSLRPVYFTLLRGGVPALDQAA